nr:MAG TPA: hypothetical protein [Caudoviricetes sp.]
MTRSSFVSWKDASISASAAAISASSSSVNGILNQSFPFLIPVGQNVDALTILVRPDRPLKRWCIKYQDKRLTDAWIIFGEVVLHQLTSPDALLDTVMVRIQLNSSDLRPGLRLHLGKRRNPPHGGEGDDIRVLPPAGEGGGGNAQPDSHLGPVQTVVNLVMVQRLIQRLIPVSGLVLTPLFVVQCNAGHWSALLPAEFGGLDPGLHVGHGGGIVRRADIAVAGDAEPVFEVPVQGGEKLWPLLVQRPGGNNGGRTVQNPAGDRLLQLPLLSVVNGHLVLQLVLQDVHPLVQLKHGLTLETEHLHGAPRLFMYGWKKCRGQNVLCAELVLLQAVSQLGIVRLHGGRDADLRQPQGNKVQFEAKNALPTSTCGELQICNPFGKNLVTANICYLTLHLSFRKPEAVTHPADTGPNLPRFIAGRHQFCAKERNALDL